MSSRITIPAREHGVTVVVGWDNPLMSFFAQVVRDQEEIDERDPVTVWVGAARGEVLRPEELAEPLAPYADLTAAHLAQLRADRAACADRGPSALQRAMSGMAHRGQR
jgi:hypothetical protein